MGLITGLVTWPLAPVRSVVWLAEQVQKQAEREWYDPERIRRELRAADDALAAGEITEEECAAIQDSLVALMVQNGRSHA